MSSPGDHISLICTLNVGKWSAVIPRPPKFPAEVIPELSRPFQKNISCAITKHKEVQSNRKQKALHFIMQVLAIQICNCHGQPMGTAEPCWDLQGPLQPKTFYDPLRNTSIPGCGCSQGTADPQKQSQLAGFPTLGAGLPCSLSAARNWETQLSSAPQQQKQLPNVGTNQGLSAQCIKTVFRQQILFSSANFFLDFYPAEDSLLCSDHISPIRWGTRQRSLRWHF